MDDVRLSSALYRCPGGFLYDPSVRRCLPGEEVSCSTTPDLGRIAREPAPVQLRIVDLEPFFAMNRY